MMKALGIECRNVGTWMQSCVAIAFIKTKPVLQENMLDLIPGCDIVINLASYSYYKIIQMLYINFPIESGEGVLQCCVFPHPFLKKLVV